MDQMDSKPQQNAVEMMVVSSSTESMISEKEMTESEISYSSVHYQSFKQTFSDQDQSTSKLDPVLNIYRSSINEPGTRLVDTNLSDHFGSISGIDNVSKVPDSFTSTLVGLKKSERASDVKVIYEEEKEISNEMRTNSYPNVRNETLFQTSNNPKTSQSMTDPLPEKIIENNDIKSRVQTAISNLQMWRKEHYDNKFRNHRQVSEKIFMALEGRIPTFQENLDMFILFFEKKLKQLRSLQKVVDKNSKKNTKLGKTDKESKSIISESLMECEAYSLEQLGKIKKIGDFIQNDILATNLLPEKSELENISNWFDDYTKYKENLITQKEKTERVLKKYIELAISLQDDKKVKDDLFEVELALSKQAYNEMIATRNFGVYVVGLLLKIENFEKLHLQNLNKTIQSYINEMKRLFGETENNFIFEKLTNMNTKLTDEFKAFYTLNRLLKKNEIDVLNKSLKDSDFKNDKERIISYLTNLNLACLEEKSLELCSSDAFVEQVDVKNKREPVGWKAALTVNKVALTVNKNIVVYELNEETQEKIIHKKIESSKIEFINTEASTNVLKFVENDGNSQNYEISFPDINEMKKFVEIYNSVAKKN